MKQAIILFTRVPQAGKTKTRMMPYLTAEECKRLHICFLQDVRQQCQKTQADLLISYTPAGADNEQKLRTIFGIQADYFPQEGNTLGEKMYHAIERVLSQGYESCILIGADIPEIKAEHLTEAFAVLTEKDIVFGRTEDGGYYLVGMKQPIPQAFGLSEYGHSKVLEQTVQQLQATGFSVGYAKTLSDLDTPDDLRALRGRLCRKETSCPVTEKFLEQNKKISIIIPIYNEEKTIEALQRQLKPLKDRCEIIFVDGGSTDRTVALLDKSYKLLQGHKGRAKQMNAGAKESTGDILFFLHCDSELPPDPLGEIRRVMQTHRAGCFGIAFHSKNFFMWTCRVISNHRVFDRKVMFGDQGIFIERELFFEAGLFPEIPIMEDYQFSLTLKEMGIPLGMTQKRIYTSDRRFPKKTIPKLRLMWKMNRLRKMYRDGVDIEVISDLYRDIR